MKLSQIRNQRVPLAIDLYGEVLNVVYNPSYITPDLEAKIAEASNSEQLATMISGMIVEWDLMDDSGSESTPYPLDAEKIGALPTLALAAILSSVAEHASESVRAEGKALPAGSPPAA